jgi:hypothetical protein
VRDAAQIERAITDFAHGWHRGRIVTPTSLTIIHSRRRSKVRGLSHWGAVNLITGPALFESESAKGRKTQRHVGISV